LYTDETVLIQKLQKQVTFIPVITLTHYLSNRPWRPIGPRLPYFLDSQLTDGGEVVSLNMLAAFYAQEDSWYSFLLETESAPGL
jgi:hypothetical protein